ncbi:MAG: DNA-directed DNA polymerase [Ignisphaera sp.]
MNYCITGFSYIINGRTEVVLTLRDENGNRVGPWFIPYSPYFYIEEEQWHQFVFFLDKHKELEERIVKTERGFLGYNGKRLFKIVVKYPRDVSKIANAIKEYNQDLEIWQKIRLYESNIPFAYRFLIDRKLYTGINDKLEPVDIDSKHRIIILDIEVLGEEDWNEGTYQYPIIIIGFYDYFTDKYTILSVSEKETQYEVDNVEDILCKDEQELIAKFKEKYIDISPDVIITFSPFDIQYLYHRLKELKIDPSFLSPINQIGKNLHIHCVDNLDYSELYKKVFGEQAYHTLDYIAKKELGYGKLFEGHKVRETWHIDKDLVKKYNLRDIKLIKDLEDKLGLIKNFIIPIWKITGLEFSKCLKANAIADILCLRDANGKYVWRSHSYVTVRPYKGALVEAKPGLYENVAVLDWKELYPSIMETFHISWDTYQNVGEKADIKIKENVYFSSKTPGQTVVLMKPLRNKREEIKNKLKETNDPKERRLLETLSSAYKSIINALYGIYGFYPKKGKVAPRLYFPEIASTITYLGRIIFQETRRYIESLGYEMVYGDTDSIFIKLKTNSLEEANNLAQSIEQHVAKFILEKYKVESKLHISLAHILRRVIILTKKRYHGITIDGQEIMKGLEAVRRESAIITSKVENRLGEILLKEDPNLAESFIENVVKDILERKIPLEELAIRPRCTKEEYETMTRNYKAIKIGEKLTEKKIRKGERFYLFYLVPNKDIVIEFRKRKVTIPMNVIGVKEISDLPLDKIQIDYERMANYTVVEPSKKYLEIIKNQKAYKVMTLDKYW